LTRPNGPVSRYICFVGIESAFVLITMHAHAQTGEASYSFASSNCTPLVVDLDGTLTPTDTLVESVLKAARSSPLTLLCLPLWLARGRAAFKETIATQPEIDVTRLPYRIPLLEYLRAEKAKGRRIILATAAHHSIADRVAKHLGLFDEVLATTAGRNLKGRSKLTAIRESVGASFVYAGDSRADLPIWHSAQAAVLVGVPKNTAALIRQGVPVEREFPGDAGGLRMWLRALRVHQWTKNLLLFVPLLTAFSFMDVSKLAHTIVAFLAFSFTASATYVINDLWDLESDRVHPRKRLRPFASAQLSIVHGLVVAASALLLGCLLALTVSKAFVLILMLYLLLTSAYTWVLKEYVLIDVIMLSLLYTLRIVAGSIAIDIGTSSWLLAFSVFMFLSLALVKRCAELFSLGASGAQATRGRDYRVTDLVVLWPLGVGAALAAVVVFGLFIHAPETQLRYGTPQLLWLVAVGLIYWLGRLWVKTSRGEMHDDPVVYAIQDHGSRIAVAAMISATLAAHFLILRPSA
jgi:4-hydroxybenzoate polyprenyltransferase/phosphoserine phosphatase